MTTQWTAGAAAGPCETDNRTFEATALTYTTPPLEKDTQLTGPIVANVWAELTTEGRDARRRCSATSTPSGASNQISAGFLLASQRAIDRKQLLVRPGPRDDPPVPPVHAREPEARHAERPGSSTGSRSIRPSRLFKKGNSIRLTIGTANTPSTSTPVPDLVERARRRDPRPARRPYASNVLLPIVG